jgi:hypothetical protein
MIENLFGVEHSAMTERFGINMGEVKVHPSIGLIKEILAYPPGTSVGLEYSPKFNRPHMVGDQKVSLPPEHRYYWQELRDVCRMAGHKVVYLEDFATYGGYIKRAIELDSLVRRLRQDNSKEEREEISRAYKLQVEVDYTFKVKRESAILETILAKKPKVVIMGKGHTEYLTQNLEELTNRGIVIGRYQTESIPHSDFFLDFAPSPRVSELDEAVTPNPDVLIERECLKRSYKAVTEGRVTNGHADFIGTWDTYIPARGLFEINITESGSICNGTIEDCLGSATFTGSFDEDKIHFIKTYDTSRSLDDAYKGDIFYRGAKTGNIYRGNFDVVLTDGKIHPGGEFTLQVI